MYVRENSTIKQNWIERERERKNLGVIVLFPGDAANEAFAGEGTVAHDDETSVGNFAYSLGFES